MERAGPPSPAAFRSAGRRRKAVRRRSGRRRSARRIAVGSVCASAIALVSWCGLGAPATVAATSQMTRRVAQATPLCASAGTVNRLVVRRTDALPQNHFRFSFPSSVVVGEPAAVQRVARALCALPAMPRQAMSCPADFGISYQLQFSRPHEHLRAVTLDATGCQTVHGLAQLRWVARTPGFWHILGTVMGLKRPTWATFRGTGPNG